MKRGDNRGLSTVIATIIIILLVIVAIGIVWGVLKNMVTKSSELITLGKFTIDLEIVSVTQNSQGTVVKVKRNPGEGELEGLVFSIFDGDETHVYEKRNVSLNQLETKTFIVSYYGDIVSVSVYPLFLTESGKSTMGEVSDIHYEGGSGGGGDGGYVDPGCIPSCDGKTCGDNGCGGTCGSCSGSTPYCVSGECQASSGGVIADCTCSLTICIGTTCDDGLGGTCYGQEEPDCTNAYGEIQCEESQNHCGDCGTCESPYNCSNGMCCPEGYHGYEGNCQPDCTWNCTSRECGPDPICGMTCGSCDIFGENYLCNPLGQCEECIQNCTGRECGPPLSGCGDSCGDCAVLHDPSYSCNMLTYSCEQCTPNCTNRECGPTLNGCGESCGNCAETHGETYSCNSTWMCHNELLNTGNVYSYWPSPQGRMLFDSEDLPTSPPTLDYTGDYIKFPDSQEDGVCMTIYDFVKPINPLVYDKTYMKISQDPTLIDIGDYYEVWGNYTMCCEDYC